MKIVFLDIDGVLATMQSYSDPVDFVCERRLYGLDKDAIQRLNRITDTTGARIVVSSTWRHGSEEKFQMLIDYLKHCGVTGSIIGRTGSHRSHFSAYRGPYYQRGDECKEWVDQHPEVTHFVCLDDDDDFDRVRDNFVRIPLGWTDGGMQDEHADKAIEILER